MPISLQCLGSVLIISNNLPHITVLMYLTIKLQNQMIADFKPCTYVMRSMICFLCLSQTLQFGERALSSGPQPPATHYEATVLCLPSVGRREGLRLCFNFPSPSHKTRSEDSLGGGSLLLFFSQKRSSAFGKCYFEMFLMVFFKNIFFQRT